MDWTSLACRYCPTLPNGGNGTTTLYNLDEIGERVGSLNGTLTNFALSGSTSNWVSDTGAGGVTALDLDGSNDHVACGENFAPTNDFTITGWIYPRTITGGERWIWHNYGTDEDNLILLRISSSTLNFFVRDGAGVSQSLSVAVTANAWQFFAVRRNGSSFYVRVGSSSNSATNGSVGSTTVSDGRTSTIGALVDTGSGVASVLFDGRIDDFCFFSSALIDDDIDDLATAPGLIDTGSSGALNVTLDGWTLTASSLTPVAGSLSSQLDWTVSATGLVYTFGQLDQTLSAWTLSATATKPGQSGSVEVTLDNWTVSAEGFASNGGAVEATLDDWTLAGFGASSVQGQLDQTLSWSLQASAQYGSGFSAALESTLADWSLSATALHNVAGGLSVTLNDWTVTASARVRSRKPRRLFAAGIHANSLFGV